MNVWGDEEREGEDNLGEKAGGGERDRGRGEDRRKRRTGELILRKKKMRG